MKEKKNLKVYRSDRPRYNKVNQWYEGRSYETWEVVALVLRPDGTKYKRWGYVTHTIPGYWRRVTDYSKPLPPLENDWTYEFRWFWDRNVRTFQEIRRQENDEVDFREENWKIKLRPERGGLPTYYDDPIANAPGRNWKRTHKVRKQWMKNL